MPKTYAIVGVRVGVMYRQGKFTPHDGGGFVAASETAILFWKAANTLIALPQRSLHL